MPHSALGVAGDSGRISTPRSDLNESRCSLILFLKVESTEDSVARKSCILSVDIHAVLGERDRRLEKAGFAVASTSSSETAMKICSSENIDLVMLGAKLPQSQKNTLLQRIKETTVVPVLSLFQKGEERFTTIRADHYLDVDEESEKLVGVVRRIVGRNPAALAAS
jgi:PleD family two-component response regulator